MGTIRRFLLFTAAVIIIWGFTGPMKFSWAVEPGKGVGFQRLEITIEQGQETQLSQLLTLEQPPGSVITWVSSDSAIAGIDSSGKLKGLGVGSVIVTARTSVKGQEAMMVVNVVQRKVEPDSLYFEVPENEHSVAIPYASLRPNKEITILFYNKIKIQGTGKSLLDPDISTQSIEPVILNLNKKSHPSGVQSYELIVKRDEKTAEKLGGYVSLTIDYDPSGFQDQENLSIFRYDAKSKNWKVVSSNVDTKRNKVTARIDTPGEFALMKHNPGIKEKLSGISLYTYVYAGLAFILGIAARHLHIKYAGRRAFKDF